MTSKNLSADQTVTSKNLLADQTVTSKNLLADQTVTSTSHSADQTVTSKNLLADQTVTAKVLLGDQTVTSKNLLADQTVTSKNLSVDQTVTAKILLGDQTVTSKNLLADSQPLQSPISLCNVRQAPDAIAPKKLPSRRSKACPPRGPGGCKQPGHIIGKLLGKFSVVNQVAGRYSQDRSNYDSERVLGSRACSHSDPTCSHCGVMRGLQGVMRCLSTDSNVSRCSTKTDSLFWWRFSHGALMGAVQIQKTYISIPTRMLLT